MINQILVIDRAVDLVTPQLAARTYGGLLLEEYNSDEIKLLSTHRAMLSTVDDIWPMLRDLALPHAQAECDQMLRVASEILDPRDQPCWLALG